LEDISKNAGISESIGGLFNNTFKVYTDDIDRWIDKTTESMGNLGKIFNNFFKSIAHRAVGSVQSSILDALFPPTEEERAAKEPFNKDILRGTQEALAGIGLTTINSANQIDVATTNTSMAMVRVAYASDTLTTAFITLASSVGGGGGLPSFSGGFGSLLPLGGGGSAASSIVRGLGTSGIGLGGLGTSGSSVASRIFSNLGTGGRNPFSAFGSLLSLGSESPAGNTLPTLSGGSAINQALSGARGLLSGGGAGGGLLSRLLGTGKGLLGSLGPQLPFMGLGLGMAAGGGGLGGILGGFGGGLAGLGLGAALSPGFAMGIGGALTSLGMPGLGAFFSATSGLALLGPIAAVAAPLIIGAMILKRNKARREGEKVRQQMSTDIVGRLTQILNDVKSDKLDGPRAISEAEQAFSDYRANMVNIKDSKTRRHAEQYITSREHPPMLLMDQINAAVGAQKLREEMKAKFIPTYAMGGIASSNFIRVSRGEKLEYGGRSTVIPGRFDGMDNILALVPQGTKIRSPHPQSIYPYAMGGVAGIAPANRPSSLNPNNGPVVNVTAVVVMSEGEAREFLDKVPNSYLAKKVAADAPINPQVLPAAILKNAQY
jgi:hypothetical protein